MDIRPPRKDAEWEQFEQMQVASFGITREAAHEEVSFHRAHGSALFAFEGQKPVGGYVVLPVKQYFGGLPVGAAAIKTVVTSPLHRGKGIAGELLRRAPRDVAHLGALCPLWAAAPDLYRRWGWDVGEIATLATVSPDALAELPAAPGILQENPPPREVSALRADVYRQWNGPLQVPAWWTHLPQSGAGLPEHRESLGWRTDGVLSGVLSFYQKQEGHGLRIHVTELIANEGSALRGLVRHLSQYAAQVSEISLQIPSQHELVYLVVGAPRSMQWKSHGVWMQRILDMAGAIEQRGWHPQAEGTMTIQVADPSFTSPHQLTLEFSKGRAHASPTRAHPDVTLDCGFFAAWYSGAITAQAGVRLGRVSGAESAIARFDSVLDGRPVWLPQGF